MVTVTTIARIGTAIGEPSRAAILFALMDGRALTAGELCRAAGVAPSTGSSHLTLLSELGLIAVVQQGRHRYHRLASPEIARLIESMMVIGSGANALKPPRRIQTGPKYDRMRLLRTCYDHLAGTIAVALADAMVTREFLILNEEAGRLSPTGIKFLNGLGWTIPSAEKGNHDEFGNFGCRSCLDWSERRPHIGGQLGAALYQFALDSKWVAPVCGSRALNLTQIGVRALEKEFGISVSTLREFA